MPSRASRIASLIFIFREESGQDLVEYSLLLALLGVVIVAVVKPLASEIKSTFQHVTAKLEHPRDFDKITNVLDSLPQGQIAFNPQDAMEIDKQYPLYLRLSQQKPLEDLQRELQSQLKNQPVEAHQIKIAPVMEAALECEGFSVSPEKPVTQAVDPRLTEWRWEVTPKRGGERTLDLRLSVIVNLDGKDYPHAIQTFERTIRVHVTPWRRVKDFTKDHWEWSCAGVLWFGRWIWKREKKKPKKPKKQKK
jgi:Flp pilus assembly pilin Flp